MTNLNMYKNTKKAVRNPSLVLTLLDLRNTRIFEHPVFFTSLASCQTSKLLESHIFYVSIVIHNLIDFYQLEVISLLTSLLIKISKLLVLVDCDCQYCNYNNSTVPFIYFIL